MWIALYVVVTYDLAETPKATSIIIIRTCIVHTYGIHLDIDFAVN